VFGDEETTIAGLPVERAIAGLDELLDEWLAATRRDAPAGSRRRAPQRVAVR
jgi:hypothetical protein